MVSRPKKCDCVIVRFWTISSGFFSSIEEASIEIIRDGQPTYLGSPSNGAFVTEYKLIPIGSKERVFLLYSSPALDAMQNEINRILNDLPDSIKENFYSIICKILKEGKLTSDSSSSCGQRSSMIKLLQTLVKKEETRNEIKDEVMQFRKEFRTEGRSGILKKEDNAANRVALESLVVTQNQQLGECTEVMRRQNEIASAQSDEIRRLEGNRVALEETNRHLMDKITTNSKLLKK